MVYKVTWVDRNYKEQSKTFVDDPNGPAENGLLKARKFKKALEEKDKKSSYGLYRSINIKMVESKLESFIRKIVKEERKRMNENPQQNKTVKSLLTKWTDENTSNRQEYLYLLSKITEESLRDANFYHNGVLNKIPNIFRIKPEFDGNHLDKIGFKFGTIVSEKCDYIASDIIGAIEFFLRMNGYQTIADNLVKLLEN